MTPQQRNGIGYALLGAGVAAMLAAALIGWAGVQRWIAVSETRTAADQLRRGRIDDARKLAARAAARVPSEIAPALLALDPTDLDALERLQWLGQRAESRDDRQAAEATVALVRVAARRPPGADLEGTGDGRIVALIAAINAGRDPGRLRLVKEESPPHRAVLRAGYTLLLRRAWQEGKVSDARAHAGALLLMDPNAPDAPVLLALVTASSPVVAEDRALAAIDAVQTDRDRVMRALAILLPQRREAMRARWPTVLEGLP